MDGVVVVLGVGRIDRHERQRAPVLARSGQTNRPRVCGLFQRRGRKDMRNMMRLKRDEAHRALGFDGADRLDHPRRRQSKAAFPQWLNRDEVAVLRFARHAGGHQIFAARSALLDRKRPPRPVGRRAIDRKGPRLHLVEDLDHSTGIGGGP